MCTQIPHDFQRQLLQATTPSMRYDGTEPFASWQKRAWTKLESLMGLPFVAVEDALDIIYEKQQEGFREIRFTFQSEAGYRVPCHLWIPDGAAGPLPVVICLQGHSKGMHISMGRPKYEGDEATIQGGDRDFAVRAVREGHCALIMEQRGFGECGGTEKGPGCYLPAMTALLLGRTTIGERVWDVRRGIDVLVRHFPQVDTDRIVCMGNSGGGTTAFYAACMDPRIGYAMVSSALCTFDDSIAAMVHCTCNYIPGIRQCFDMGDLAGLIAPRPLVVVSGREDEIFPQHGVQQAFADTKRQYTAAGAADRCALVVADGGHRFYADAAWPVMNGYLKA